MDHERLSCRVSHELSASSMLCGAVTPHLIVRNSREAVEFYKSAFGAVELYSSPLPMNSGMHFHLRINDTFVMATDECLPT